MVNTKDKEQELWIKGLIKSIHEEIVAHQVLLNKLKAQQFAITDRDVLHLFARNQEALDSKDKAEKASENRINVLKQGNGIRPSYEFDSIEKVIPLVKSEFSEKLLSQRQKLLDVLKDIKSSNRVTKYLLDQSIEFINQNIRMISTELDHGGSYNASGFAARKTKVSTISQLR